jgi:glycosyltransferase involved in cell wall biosynthesis
MAHQARVAVVIPAYNAELWVRDAIASVLAQGSPEVEAIVVDDGSTDQTAAAVSRFAGGVRYVYQPHQGAAAARNRAILCSGSELIAFLDADDFWLPGALHKLVPCFDDPSVGLVCGDNYRWTGAGPYETSPRKWSRRRPDAQGDYWKTLLHWNFLSMSTTMVRRSVLERTGLFDEQLRCAHDYDLWLRIARAGVRFAFIDQPVGIRRLRSDSISADTMCRLDAHCRIWEKLLRLDGLHEEDRLQIMANRRRTRSRYRPAAVSLSLAGRIAEARRCFRMASLFRPHDPRNLLGWVLTAWWPGAARKAARAGWLGGR